MYLLSKPTKKGFCAQCEQHARSLDTACRELAKISGWNHKHVQRIEALESALPALLEIAKLARAWAETVAINQPHSAEQWALIQAVRMVL